MGRNREVDVDVDVDEVRTLPEDDKGPIPLDPINALAGIGSGLELTAGELPPGIAGNDEAQMAYVRVEDVGRLLRLGEATIRRLIRTAVIKPIMVDGKIRIPMKQIESYRAMVSRGTPEKPSE